MVYIIFSNNFFKNFNLKKSEILGVDFECFINVKSERVTRKPKL